MQFKPLPPFLCQDISARGGTAYAADSKSVQPVGSTPTAPTIFPHDNRIGIGTRFRLWVLGVRLSLVGPWRVRRIGTSRRPLKAETTSSSLVRATIMETKCNQSLGNPVTWKCSRGTIGCTSPHDGMTFTRGRGIHHESCSCLSISRDTLCLFHDDQDKMETP